MNAFLSSQTTVKQKKVLFKGELSIQITPAIPHYRIIHTNSDHFFLFLLLQSADICKKFVPGTPHKPPVRLHFFLREFQDPLRKLLRNIGSIHSLFRDPEQALLGILLHVPLKIGRRHTEI